MFKFDFELDETEEIPGLPVTEEQTDAIAETEAKEEPYKDVTVEHLVRQKFRPGAMDTYPCLFEKKR